MSERARIVAIYSAGGGTGKTLVASNLALSLHQQQSGRVLLVDGGHPMPGDLPIVLGVERVKALADMVPIIGRLTPEVFASYLVTTREGLPLMSLVTDVIQSRLITPELFNKMIDLASEAFDIVVLDLASGVGPLTQAMLDRCDNVVVVVDATPSGLPRTRYCLDYLRSVQMPDSGLLICANRVSERGGMPVERVERILGQTLVTSMPDDPEVVAGAVAKGQALVLAAPRHAITRGIDRLARELTTRELRAREEAAEVPAQAPVSDDEENVRNIRRRIHTRLVEEIDLKKADLNYLKDPVKLQEVRTRAEAKVLILLDEEGGSITSRDVRRKIVKEVLDEALGLGPLEDLLADPKVTEIMVNRADQIYVERSGKLEMTKVRFLGNEQLRGVIERIVAPLGRRIDETMPMVDARLTRRVACQRHHSAARAARARALTIRKFSKRLLGSRRPRRVRLARPIRWSRSCPPR